VAWPRNWLCRPHKPPMWANAKLAVQLLRHGLDARAPARHDRGDARRAPT
jgi:hypothetical protein